MFTPLKPLKPLNVLRGCRKRLIMQGWIEITAGIRARVYPEFDDGYCKLRKHVVFFNSKLELPECIKN